MSSQRRFFQLICLLISLISTSLMGCNSEFQEFCSGAQEAKYRDAIAALEPWKDAVPYENRSQDKGMRGLASFHAVDQQPLGSRSQEGDAAPVMLAEQDRDAWLGWAEKELKQMENALDWANIHRDEFPHEKELRQQLSEAANQIVAFHGYCQQGRVDRMIATLKLLDQRRERLRVAGCGVGR